MPGATSALGLLVGVVVCLALLESGTRLYRWRCAPPRLRLLYASFLLSDEAVRAIAMIQQRAERAGVDSFDELFQLYATASGRSKDDIERLFGFRMSWRRLNRSQLLLKSHLRWHIGVVPIPEQPLRTMTITERGTRSTGVADAITGQMSSIVRRVLITGGSVAFGQGATSDEATIPGRLQAHLNRHGADGGYRWEVLNGAIVGATSFQELIAALQSEDAAMPLDYVVSISGWNDVDQQFGYGDANVSALAQGYTSSLERDTVWRHMVRASVGRLLLFSVLRRWADGYRRWPGPLGSGEDERRTGAVRRDIDRPDVYPLW